MAKYVNDSGIAAVISNFKQSIDSLQASINTKQNKITTNSITENLIANNSISSSKIQAGSINASKIANNAINQVNIGDRAIIYNKCDYDLRDKYLKNFYISGSITADISNTIQNVNSTFTLKLISATDTTNNIFNEVKNALSLQNVDTSVYNPNAVIKHYPILNITYANNTKMVQAHYQKGGSTTDETDPAYFSCTFVENGKTIIFWINWTSGVCTVTDIKYTNTANINNDIYYSSNESPILIPKNSLYFGFISQSRKKIYLSVRLSKSIKKITRFNSPGHLSFCDSNQIEIYSHKGKSVLNQGILFAASYKKIDDYTLLITLIAPTSNWLDAHEGQYVDPEAISANDLQAFASDTSLSNVPLVVKIAQNNSFVI